MRWLERLSWRRAAKAYARRLGTELATAYGGPPPYTPQQVAAAVQRLKLNPKFVSIGYAAFVSEPDYQALESSLPLSLPRAVARSLFEHYRPLSKVTGDSFEPPPLHYY
jgi:hypothetical protein